MAEPTVTWSLGMISSDPPRMELSVSIGKIEHSEYLAAINKLALIESPSTFRLLSRNYHDLLNVRRYIEVAVAAGPAIGRPDRRQLVESYMGNVVNWLAAFRLYLDHSETILKRMYGGESQQWISFKQACSDAYDSLVGYRFVYKFRNYVQHCGLPIDTFRVSAATPDRVADGQRLVAILLQRKQLLSNYREWGPVKADLRGFEEEFALDDLFEQAMEGVRRIEEVRIVSAVQVAAAEIYRLRQALERVEDVPEGSHVHLFESRHASEGGSIEVTPVAIPVAAVEMLEAVAEGSADASSFIVRPTAPELPLDPTNVHESHWV